MIALVLWLLGLWSPMLVGSLLAGMWWGWMFGLGVFVANLIGCWLIDKWVHAGAVRSNEGSWVGMAYPIITGIITLVVVLAVHFL